MDGEAEPIGAGLKLLVVDDEPVVRQFLKLVLSELGFEVETLASSAEARMRAANGDVDILLVDKNLQDGSGLELCREFADGGASQCKVMMMSGQATLESAIEAIRHGAVDYFCKPFGVDEVRARLPRVIGSASRRPPEPAAGRGAAHPQRRARVAQRARSADQPVQPRPPAGGAAA